MSTHIVLTGIEGIGYHGVFPHERVEGQRFLVDVDLSLRSSKAAKSDDLNDAIDYARVISMVHEEIAGEPVNLIEKLAQKIASKLVSEFAVKKVEVTVHKPDAPVGLKVGDIAVRVTRQG